MERNTWIKDMKMSVETETMIAYLQSMMDVYKEREEKYGYDDVRNEHLLGSMLACKDMVEALIGAPVNLQKDGKVTIGF